MKYFRRIGLLAAAFFLMGCQENVGSAHRLPQCVDGLDNALTYALRKRAAQLEDQYQRIWDQTQEAGGVNKSPRDAIAVANIAPKYGELNGQSIFADPLAGSMTLAAQSSWRQGKAVLPHSPNVVIDEKRLTSKEEELLSAAYGWSIEVSRGSGYVVDCTYSRELGLNPWRNAYTWAPIERAWRNFTLGPGDLRLVARVDPEFRTIHAEFVGPTEVVDTHLLRLMDKSYANGAFFSYSPVGTVKSLERARALRREEDQRLSRMNAPAIHQFWFEEQ